MTPGQHGTAPIMDSRMTLREALEGTGAPTDVVGALWLEDVRYYSFDGVLHQGQLVVHKDVRNDIGEIFRSMERLRFPVIRPFPSLPMAGRTMPPWPMTTPPLSTTGEWWGQKGSLVTPAAWPWTSTPSGIQVVYNSGRISPPGAVYRPGDPGVLTADHPVVVEFLRRGWQWGGNFKSMKDYHHFDRIMAR